MSPALGRDLFGLSLAQWISIPGPILGVCHPLLLESLVPQGMEAEAQWFFVIFLNCPDCPDCPGREPYAKLSFFSFSIQAQTR